MKLVWYMFLSLSSVVAGVYLYRYDRNYISTVILPHHDLVAEQRYEMLNTIKENVNGRPIVLLSPNHYETGRSYILLHQDDFETKYGTVHSSSELVGLATSLGARDDIGGYSNEHGVYSILPDIARLFPDSEILTLVVSSRTPDSSLDEFMSSLQSGCADCILFASADMSHYQPYALSELHDEVTLRALNQLDSSFLGEKAEVGPPHVMRQAVLWAERAGTERFVLQNHTNSTELSGDYFIEGTTHIFGWYQNGNKNTPEPSVSFTAAGDVSFDGGVRAGSDIFRALGDRVLWGTDTVFMNLEGVYADHVLEHWSPFKKVEPDKIRLENPDTSINTLKYIHTTAVNIANNHQYDWGEEQANYTRRFIQDNGIATLEPQTPLTVGVDGMQLHILSIDVTREDSPDLDEVIRSFEAEKSRTIVYAHWGKEFEREPFESQRDYAKSWIGAGADLIIGTGSHVIGEAESIQGVPVFYSLGNFIYDKDFNPEGRGLVLSGVFTENGLKIVASLITNRYNKLILQRSEAANDELKSLFPDFSANIIDERGGLVFEF